MSQLSANNEQSKSLALLVEECRSQLKQFRRGKSGGSEQAEASPSCAEIVRRAAAGIGDALAAMLEESAALIRSKCPPDLRYEVEDLVQDVNLRLIRKFRNKESPYSPTTYPAYVSYLNLTIRSAVSTRLEKNQRSSSLEELQEVAGYEPSQPSHAKTIEQRILLEKLLSYLTNPLEREAVFRRYTYRETPDEIAEALREQSPEITKKQVYRLIERGVRRLSEHPDVVRMRSDE